MDETEVKITGIDPARIRALLRSNKAKTVKKVLQRNTLYKNDYTRERKTVLRIREEGKRAILGVKANKRIVKGHKVLDEYELPVDAAIAKSMVLALGFTQHEIVEMRREYYRLHNCSVEIIELPGLPHYLEIEGKIKDIAKVAKLLGYSKKDYDARGIKEIFGYKGDLRF